MVPPEEEDLDKLKGQIFEFRDRAFADGPVACALTGAPVVKAKAHIDHQHPDTFLRILERFLAQEGVTLGAVRVNDTEDMSAVTRLADLELERRWQEYHRSRAAFQVTSARANLSQGG